MASPFSLKMIGLYLGIFSGVIFAEELQLNPDHPDHYTVVSGDTLWDIAGRFLTHSWQWPEIWHHNPDLVNPHLIYPGDVLVLSYDHGRPSLAVETPSELRLNPEIRSSPITEAIPVIPMNAIHQFLGKPQVVSEHELKNAAYIVDFGGEHVIGGAGDSVYARALADRSETNYAIFRSGQVYKDADTGVVLGYEAVYAGDAQLQRAGDPAILLLTRTDREVLIGDRLLPLEQEKIQINFQPHAPKTSIRGHIINVVDGVSQIGQFHVVALDRGSADGLEIGHVLDIFQSRSVVRGQVDRRIGETVKLPEEKAGELMVFRVFERVSYALVMKTTRNLNVLDVVQTP